MKRDTYQLEDVNGYLAVVYRTTSSNEPAEKITHTFLTESKTDIARTHFNWTLPLPVCYSQIRGAYFAQVSDREEREIPTKGEPATTIEPYPCPKVRKGTETRYWCGYWQRWDNKTRKWLNLE